MTVDSASHSSYRNTGAGAAWWIDFALVVLPALAAFAYCLIDPYVWTDGDTNWHVATGRWILAHLAVPTTDPFSYTSLGHPWVSHEWLSEVLMAMAWAAWGWSGVILLMAAAAAAAMALLAGALRRSVGVLSTIVALTLSMTVLLPHFLARPHVIALPLLVLWTAQLLKARRADRTPPLWLLPIMTLWANLHGSFIFGLVFTCFFALEAYLAAASAVAAARLADAEPAGGDEEGRFGAFVARDIGPFFAPEVVAVAFKWGAFLVAATLMAMITPSGAADVTYPFYVMSMKNLRFIAEWKAVSFQTPSSLEFALLFTLFVCLYRGVRMGAVRLGLLLALLYMTLQHMRQEIVLAVAAPLLLAEPLGRALEPALTADEQAPAWPAPRLIAAPVAAAALLFVALATWRVTVPEIRKDSIGVPVTALSHVPKALLTKPVFNDYSFGGWLVFKGVRPFIDGRSDMYGDDLLRLYLDAESGDQAAITKAFHRYNIQWTILAAKSPLAAKLDATPGWRRLYADKWAVVQARDDAVSAANTPTPPPSRDAIRHRAPPPPRRGAGEE